MGDHHDVVLGAGLAGLTAAYTLQQAGESDWLVLEKEREPGGHARSVVVDGYVFDFGPHILFSNDAAMEALIRDLLGDNMRAQERQAFIYHAAHDLYTRFPFQAHLYGLPVELVRRVPRGARQRGRAARPQRLRAGELRAVDAGDVRRRDRRPADDPVRAEDLDGRAVRRWTSTGSAVASRLPTSSGS